MRDYRVPPCRDGNLYPSALDASPHAQIIVDGNGLLAVVNERARTLFNLAPADLGRPIQDLEVSYRPVELRSLMAQVLDQRRPIVLREVQWDAPERETRYMDVHVNGLNGHNGRPMGVSVSFVDVSRLQELQLQRIDRSRTSRGRTRSCSRRTKSWRR